MEIQNDNTKPNKSDQRCNVNIVQWESMNITTQAGEIYGRKSKVIMFLVNARIDVTVNKFYISNPGKKLLLFCSIGVLLDIYIGNIFIKFNVIDGKDIERHA